MLLNDLYLQELTSTVNSYSRCAFKNYIKVFWLSMLGITAYWIIFRVRIVTMRIYPLFLMISMIQKTLSLMMLNWLVYFVYCICLLWLILPLIASGSIIVLYYGLSHTTHIHTLLYFSIVLFAGWIFWGWRFCNQTWRFLHKQGKIGTHVSVVMIK